MQCEHLNIGIMSFLLLIKAIDMEYFRLHYCFLHYYYSTNQHLADIVIISTLNCHKSAGVSFVKPIQKGFTEVIFMLYWVILFYFNLSSNIY